MNANEIFKLVNDLDIPAELSGEQVNYIEEIENDGDSQTTVFRALDQIKHRHLQLETVGLRINNSNFDGHTIRGIIQHIPVLR
jgi:uncharacterized protein YjaG (DUF416 family)